MRDRDAWQWISLWGFLLVVCSERPRINPLDPSNPVTRGRVQGVEAVSLKHTVTVRWDPVFMPGIRSYHVYRHEEGDADFVRVGSIGPEKCSFIDSGLAYDRTYAYRVTVKTLDGYESPPSEPTVITPGPLTYWVLDYAGRIVRLTYDGRHRLWTLGHVSWPIAAVSDSISRRLWVVDYGLGFLYKLSFEGQILARWGGLTNPTEIALDPLTHTLWIVHQRRSELVALDTNGVIRHKHSGFQEIRAIAWSGQEGMIWVADRKRGGVGLLTEQGWNPLFPLKTKSIPHIDVDRQTGVIWIADSLRIDRLQPEGERLSCIDLTEPVYAISVNQSSGDAWVILYDRARRMDLLLRIDPDGTPKARVEGLKTCESLVANPSHGGCLVAEAGRGRVAMFDGEGNLMALMDGFAQLVQVLNE